MVGRGRAMAFVKKLRDRMFKSSDKIAEDCRSKGFLHVTSHISDPLPAKVALAVLDVIAEEDLNKRALTMGKYLQDGLLSLQQKHEIIGDVRGKGLFLGAELVADRATREPMEEKKVAAVVADCNAQGVIIGMTNRSIPGLNNTLCLSPALIATADDIDQITGAIDGALGRVFG